MLVARCFWAFTSVCNFRLTCLHSCTCLLCFFGCFFFVNSLHHCYLVKLFAKTLMEYCLIDNLHPSSAEICYLADFMFDLHPFKGSYHFIVFVNTLLLSLFFFFNKFFFMTYTHLWDLVISLASSVTYIPLDGILLLSPFFMTYAHLRDLVFSLVSSVTYIRLGNLVT